MSLIQPTSQSPLEISTYRVLGDESGQLLGKYRLCNKYNIDPGAFLGQPLLRSKQSILLIRMRLLVTQYTEENVLSFFIHSLRGVSFTNVRQPDASWLYITHSTNHQTNQPINQPFT